MISSFTFLPFIKNKLKSNHFVEGFSLIELLAVIVIISILVGIFGISIGNIFDDNTNEDIRRLKALIELAQEEGAIQGKDFGLKFYRSGYEFSEYKLLVDDKGSVLFSNDSNPVVGWIPIKNDQKLRARNFKNEIYLELELDDKRVLLGSPEEINDEYIPNIYIWSNGELDPLFKLTLNKPNLDNALILENDSNDSLNLYPSNE